MPGVTALETIAHRALIGAIILILLASGVLFEARVASVRAAPLPQTASSLHPSHSYAFGQSASFTLGPLSDPPPTRATLFLDVNGRELASYKAEIQDDRIEYRRDLASQPLPPFAEITYWWQLEMPEMSLIKTEPITFRYVDNRYTWQSLDRGSLSVHWISGATEMMASALDVSTQALADLAYALHPPDPGNLHIYIYPSHLELHSAMQLVGHTWAGGISYPELNVILVAIPATDETIVRMKRTIPHELTHQTLYNRLGKQGYQNLPAWLNEGLATNFEQSPNATYALMLEGSQDLIPLRTLCNPFPDDEARARLAYAQSQSVVSYLRQAYGWSTIRDLLDVYADGVGCETGLVRTLSTDLETLERQWTQWLAAGAIPDEVDPLPQSNLWIRTQTWAELMVASTGPWLVFAGFLLIPGALTLVLPNRKT